MSAPHLVQLANGLTVLVDERPHLHSVGISALVRVGSGDEGPSEAGLSHLLEHMLFRGSHAYPSSDALMAPFEDAGGMLEAETWRDHTHFFAEVHHQHLQPAVRALGDMLSRPRLTGLVAERRLVEAEIQADLDEHGHETDLHALSRKAVWGDVAMARRVTGDIAQVRRLTRACLQRHHRAHYVGRRMVLSFCGAVRVADAVGAARQAFAHLPAGTPAAPLPPVSFAARVPLTVWPGYGGQVGLQLSFAAAGVNSVDEPLQDAVASVLGEGMLSRLQQALSESSGLVYAFEGGLDVYPRGGTYDVELQVSPQRAVRALNVACDTLKTLAMRGPTREELERVRQRERLHRHMQRDRPAERCYEQALDRLFGRTAPPSPPPLSAWQQRVQTLARRMFLEGPRHLTAVGPISPALQRALQHAWQRAWPAGFVGSEASARIAHGAAPARKRAGA